MTQALITQPAVQVASELHDHCDSCGAAAKLLAGFGAAGELAFCGHHANRYADRIVATADRVAVEAGFSWRGA